MSRHVQGSPKPQPHPLDSPLYSYRDTQGSRRQVGRLGLVETGKDTEGPNDDPPLEVSG